MKKRIASFVMIVCMLFFICTANVSAAESYGYSIKSSGTSVSIGAEVDVVMSLTDYSSKKSGITGLQIDFGNIDPNVIEVISQASMAGVNSKATYQPKRKLIRFLYIDVMGGSELDRNVTDLIKFKIKIKDTITQSGSITLPITIKIANTASDQIVLKDSITINYSPKNPDIVNVDITWGDMDFIYDDGVWNSQTHKWDNSGWKAATNQSNLINITNNSTTDVKLAFSYAPNAQFTTLDGEFLDNFNKAVTQPVNIKADAQVNTFKFNLQGSVESRWSDKYVALGKITVKIL